MKKILVVLLLLVCIPLTASLPDYVQWHGKWLYKSELTMQNLLILPDDRTKFSAFEKELKTDMRDYLQFVSNSHDYPLQNKDIVSVQLKLTEFNKDQHTVRCVVTGKYRYYTGDYCNDAQYNATHTENLSLTVALGMRNHNLFYQLQSETIVKNIVESACSIS